jgi:hypothetical protein
MLALQEPIQSEAHKRDLDRSNNAHTNYNGDEWEPRAAGPGALV